jgi:hypothetical protein
MNIENIDKYLAIGIKDRNWFQTCESLFIEQYGQEKLKLVAQLFAATSIASSLKSNIQLFRKALYQMENSLPFEGYLPNIRVQLELIKQGKEISGRKIRSFANAMSGDINAVVVDRWLLRAFELDRQYMRHTGPHKGKVLSGGPTDKQYTMIENYVRDLAKELKLEARQVSSMIWSGVRISQSGDRETNYGTILRLKNYNMYERTDTQINP